MKETSLDLNKKKLIIYCALWSGGVIVFNFVENDNGGTGSFNYGVSYAKPFFGTVI